MPLRFNGESDWVTIRGVCGLAETNGENIEGSGPISGEFLFGDCLVSTFPGALSDSDGCIVDPNPPTRYIFRAAAEGIREGGVSAADFSDGQGVLFSHKFVRASRAIFQ